MSCILVCILDLVSSDTYAKVQHGLQGDGTGGYRGMWDLCDFDSTWSTWSTWSAGCNLVYPGRFSKNLSLTREDGGGGIDALG